MARGSASHEQRSAFIFSAPSLAVMLVFFFVPIVTVIVYSVMTSESFSVSLPFTFHNFASAFTLPAIRQLAWNSIVTGFLTSTFTVALAMAIAYWLQFSAGRFALPVAALIVATMFAGYLVRIYAWRTMLGTEGVVNSGLQSAHVTDGPVGFLLFNRFSVVIAETHLSLPFAVVILYAAIRPIKPDLLFAAEDLGGGPWIRWTRVVLPLMAAPIASAWMFVFIVSSADFVTPQFLGGKNGQLIGNQVNRYFREAGDYGRGAALAVLMMVFYALLYGVIQLGLRAARLNKIEWG